MNNPFKKILHHYEVPNLLKQKVMTDIGMLKISMDVTTLLNIKSKEIYSDLLRTTSK